MMENKISAIESLLFFWGDPLDYDSIEKILEINKNTLNQLIEQLEEKYKNESSGIELKIINDSIQLVTKAKNSDYIKKLTTKIDNKTLSNSLMETLSIIAYKQPITRVEIDNIRGVNSSSSINTLVNRNLVEELGKLDQIGKPIIYGTTDEFLRVFALETLEDLPSENDFEEISIKDE